MSRPWYCVSVTGKEVELDSPSRRDDISTLAKESKLRSQYCSHIEKLGHHLRLPRSTTATALVLCHRFYARQSHAKNDWLPVATACLFLASNVQDTPRSLPDVVNAAYSNEMHQQMKAKMIRYKTILDDKFIKEEFCNKRMELLRARKKELVAAAERVVLRTIGFDIEVRLPYKPLVAALKRILAEDDVTADTVGGLSQIAWSLVEEWLKTNKCLQYKPQYIAVGSVVVAARLLNVKLPAGEKWLRELGVYPELLDGVTRWMESKIGKVKKKTS